MEIYHSLARVFCFVCLLFLAGCSDVGDLVNQSKDELDKAARILEQAPCAMTVGALVRSSEDRKVAVLNLCEEVN